MPGSVPNTWMLNPTLEEGRVTLHTLLRERVTWPGSFCLTCKLVTGGAMTWPQADRLWAHILMNGHVQGVGGWVVGAECKINWRLAQTPLGVGTNPSHWVSEQGLWEVILDPALIFQGYRLTGGAAVWTSHDTSSFLISHLSIHLALSPWYL